MKEYLKVNPINLPTAISSLAFIIPLMNSKDTVLSVLILNSGFWSFWSHLYQNHKHGMGLKLHTKKFSVILDNLDIFGCFLLFLYVLCNIYGEKGFIETLVWLIISPLAPARSDLSLLLSTLMSFGILIYSEIFSKSRMEFIISHCVWHLSIFFLLSEWVHKI